MISENQKELLLQPVATLPLSEELITKLASRGYKNLEQVLNQKLSHVRSIDGLTIHDELELFELVQENGLEKLWREE